MLKIQASEPALPDDGQYILGQLRVIGIGADGEEYTYLISDFRGLPTAGGYAVRVELEIEPADR